MFPAFMARGIEMVGVDISTAMIASARARLDGVDGPTPRLVRGDITRLEDLHLPAVDGAICPINSLSCLLTPGDAARHLVGVAHRLRPGGRYAIQLDLNDLSEYVPSPVDATNSWIMDTDGMRLRTTWNGEHWDPDAGVETCLVRFEILEGDRVPRVVESRERMRPWDRRSWSTLVEGSPFSQVAAFDGNHPERPPLDVGPELEAARLTWHLLELPA